MSSTPLCDGWRSDGSSHTAVAVNFCIVNDPYIGGISFEIELSTAINTAKLAVSRWIRLDYAGLIISYKAPNYRAFETLLDLYG